MTEETCLFASTTAYRTGSSGRSTSCPSTIITTYPSSSRESARNRNHTDSFLCRESLICLKKVVLKFFQSSLSWSFPLRVSSYNFQIRPASFFETWQAFNFIVTSRLEHTRPWDSCDHTQNFAIACHLLRHHRRGLGTILPLNSPSAEPDEDKECELGRQNRIRPKEVQQPGWPYSEHPRDIWITRRWGCIY